MALRTEMSIAVAPDRVTTQLALARVFGGKLPRGQTIGGRTMPIAAQPSPTMATFGPFQKLQKVVRAVKLDTPGTGSNSGSARPRGSYYWGL